SQGSGPWSIRCLSSHFPAFWRLNAAAGGRTGQDDHRLPGIAYAVDGSAQWPAVLIDEAQRARILDKGRIVHRLHRGDQAVERGADVDVELDRQVRHGAG